MIIGIFIFLFINFVIFKSTFLFLFFKLKQEFRIVQIQEHLLAML